MRRVLRSRRTERGSVILEFALMSTMLMIVLFGILNFGLAIWQYNMISNLAQEGARWASVHGSGSNAPATTANVQTFVQSRSPGITLTVTTTPAPSTITAGSTVQVVVSKTFAPFTAYVPAAAMALSSTAKMVMAR